MRDDVTKLLANNWHALPHEDGRPRRLLHLSQFGQSQDNQRRIQHLTHDLGECVQHLLERNGYEIRHRDDPKAADEEGYKVARIKCGRCGKQLLAITVDDQMQATMSRIALQSITQLQTECPHE